MDRSSPYKKLFLALQEIKVGIDELQGGAVAGAEGLDLKSLQVLLCGAARSW